MLITNEVVPSLRPVSDRRENILSTSAIETYINKQAAHYESLDTTFDERYWVARRYANLTDADIAKKLGIPIRVVRRWGVNVVHPFNLPMLTSILRVTVTWLIEGGEENLLADCRIGRRVGKEQRKACDALYGHQLYIISEISEDANDSVADAYLEQAVFQRPKLSRLARHAGGRWVIAGAIMVFRPWGN